VVQKTIELIVYGVVAASFARWIYVHWRFWSILREEQPELSKKLSSIPFAGVRGRSWIDFAIAKKHRGLGSERLEKAGDALVNAYGKFQMSWAFLWLAFAIWFGVNLLISS
jgi:hypothetical protein